MHLADALSRGYISGQIDPEELIEFEVMAVNPISPSKHTELVDASQNDAILSQLSQVIMQGNWPNKFKSAPNWQKPFYPFRDVCTLTSIL